MRSNGTPLYWRLIDRLMLQYGIGQNEAKRLLLARTVKRAVAAGHSHYHISSRLKKEWGIHHATYYRQLSRIRQHISIP